MRYPILRQCLGMSIVVAVMVLGCNHASRRCCQPCDCVTSIRPVASIGGSTSESCEDVNTVVHTDKTKPTVIMKVEPIQGNIAMTAVAPGATLGQDSIAGTIELTPAEADSMGVKPGYTPSALYVPATPRPLPQAPSE